MISPDLISGFYFFSLSISYIYPTEVFMKLLSTKTKIVQLKKDQMIPKRYDDK